MATCLGNQGSVLFVSGHFLQSDKDFEARFSHFDDVGDAYGLVETIVTWGYDYYAPLKDWDDAPKTVMHRRSNILMKSPEVFSEAKVRLTLAYGQFY